MVVAVPYILPQAVELETTDCFLCCWETRKLQGKMRNPVTDFLFLYFVLGRVLESLYSTELVMVI